MDTNKITDPLNRGMVAGLLGMPADIVNMFRNAGRSVQNLTLMAQNKPTIPMQQDPAYGQEWFGNKLAQFGYVSPNRNAMAEFAAGLLDPTGFVDTLAVKAPALAQGLFNLGDPALMTVTKGLLAKKAYDVAPDVARVASKNLSAPATLNRPGFAGQRGAINISEGDAMEYIKSGVGDDLVRLFHGTNEDGAKGINNLGYIKGGNYYGVGPNMVALTPRKKIAEEYANGGTVFEVLIPKRKLVVDPESFDSDDLEEALKLGASVYATSPVKIK